jgi:hypothetical protein
MWGGGPSCGEMVPSNNISAPLVSAPTATIATTVTPKGDYAKALKVLRTG